MKSSEGRLVERWLVGWWLVSDDGGDDDDDGIVYDLQREREREIVWKSLLLLASVLGWHA